MSKIKNWIRRWLEPRAAAYALYEHEMRFFLQLRKAHHSEKPWEVHLQYLGEDDAPVKISMTAGTVEIGEAGEGGSLHRDPSAPLN